MGHPARPRLLPTRAYPLLLLLACTVGAAAPAHATTTEGVLLYRRIGLALDGATTTGAPVHDEAAVLYFVDEGTEGWDPYDASKAPPLTSPAGNIALVGPGPDGLPRWLAQRSLPLNPPAPVAMPLAFMATHAGSYTISVRALASVPPGWGLTLTDHVTGAVTGLKPEVSYTFTSEAATTADRFTLTVVPNVTTGTEAAIPDDYALGPVAPNPSAAGARTILRVRDAQSVRADVFDVLGRRVAVVFEGALPASGTRVLEVETGSLPAGAYVLRVTGETFRAALAFRVVV